MNKNFAGENTTVKMIPTELIRALPQVRTTFKDSSIAELAADIEAHGVLQPLVVRPDGKGYTIIIGERRFRAIQKLNAPFVPAIVAEIKETEREEIQLIENIQREDLSAKDLTGSIHKLWKKHGSVAKVAQICNKSKSWVSKRLAIALEVGALTVQLLDANIKDVELLYAFSMLEKADDQRARALLPDILEKQKGRKDVQSELQIALGKKADSKPEEKEESQNLDLFDTPTVATDQNQKDTEIKLEAAIDALHAVAKQAKKRSDGKCWILSNAAMEELTEAIAKIVWYSHDDAAQ
jgi:ParB family chromosome partitioning protein